VLTVAVLTDTNETTHRNLSVTGSEDGGGKFGHGEQGIGCVAEPAGEAGIFYFLSVVLEVGLVNL
jgi:hypothetical protein